MNDQLYYCENCGEEYLTRKDVVEDNIGGIFCCVDCLVNFNTDFCEGRNIPLEYREVQNERLG